MKIAAYQLLTSEQVEQNLEQVVAGIETATQQDVQILAFPEGVSFWLLLPTRLLGADATLSF